jgi:hypothetical protein
MARGTQTAGHPMSTHKALEEVQKLVDENQRLWRIITSVTAGYLLGEERNRRDRMIRLLRWYGEANNDPKAAAHWLGSALTGHALTDAGHGANDPKLAVVASSQGT